MKRRLGLLLAAVTLAVAVGVSVSPASAVPTDVCVGQGRAILTSGFGYPASIGTPGTKHTSTFTFVLTAGTCIFKTNLAASGTVTGYCGQSEGKGTTNNGRDFVLTSGGGVIVITGEFVGFAHTVPDPTIANNSCLNKTATNFLVDLFTVKNPCSDTYWNSKGKPVGDVGTNVWLCV